MKKKIVITAGGTGGHIYPALALADQLKSAYSIHFIGGGLATNSYFAPSNYSYTEISSSPLPFRHPLKLVKGLWKMGRGVIQSRKSLCTSPPDLIVGFGSFYTFPLLWAAKQLKIPFILHEANTIPGRVNRLMAPYAEETGVHFSTTAALLKGKTTEVGLPGARSERYPLEEARASFGLLPNRCTLLVSGGSQGANAISSVFLKVAQELPKDAFQVIHITGNSQMSEMATGVYKRCGISAYVTDFCTEIDQAWSAADCAIGRAGAGTVAELIASETPTLLIPFPGATDQHQMHNALFVSETIGGGMHLPQEDLTPDLLRKCIEKLVEERETCSKQLRTYRESRPKETLETRIHTYLNT